MCHYIDDFAVLGKTEQAMDRVMDAAERLGLPYGACQDGWPSHLSNVFGC